MSPEHEQEILQRLTRVETKIDMMISAREMAQEALQSTKAAHHRLDKLEGNQTWIWRTVIGGIIAACIGIIFKIKGGS